MNPVALITGASRGIGRGIGLELARLGWDLVVNFRSSVSAAQTTARDAKKAAQSAGHRIGVRLCQADISLTQDRAKLVKFAKAHFGRIDLLVNNAGIAPPVRADIMEASEESFDQVFRTNVKGPYFLTQLVARLMIRQVQRPARGISRAPKDIPGVPPRIVSISSISAYTASVNRGEYCMAKAAVSMLTPLYAARLAEHGIGVYEIRPGLISTDMTEPVKGQYDRLINAGLTPIRRWGLPGDVGKAVAAIAGGFFPFSTGEVINVDGGFHIRRL